jgi:hypothetical protein
MVKIGTATRRQTRTNWTGPMNVNGKSPGRRCHAGGAGRMLCGYDSLVSTDTLEVERFARYWLADQISLCHRCT